MQILELLTEPNVMGILVFICLGFLRSLLRGRLGPIPQNTSSKYFFSS